MRYFLTGGTGFIGGEVARQLRAAGHDVIALIRSPQKAQTLRDLGVTLCQGDITDKDSMRGPMAGVDGVFHIAGWYKISEGTRQEAEAINLRGTRNVFELVRDLQIPKAVYTSTVAVYGNTRGVVPDENYTFAGGRFTNEYERTKWIAYHQIALPMIHTGLPLVVVLPGVVYGPGDPSLLHRTLVQYMFRRLPAAPKGTAYSWSHVEDIARGHILAMDKGTPGESYILGGQIYTALEALKLRGDVSGIRPVPIHFGPGMFKLVAAVTSVLEKFLPIPVYYRSESLHTFGGVTYIGNDAKARRELGYTERPLLDGLREVARQDMEQRS